MNCFVYIIWNNAYPYKEKILKELSANFEIIKTVEITWTKENFNENLNRFYGQKLPPNSFKEKACGYGPFTLVVINDEKPKYEERITTRGEKEIVNVHTFDMKMLFREWTALPSGNNCVHGTNTPEETEHDLTLLLGICPDDFCKVVDSVPTQTQQDIVGANGWDNLSQLFYVLNHTVKYVFMRNFEGIPNTFNISGHDDIDLLVDDLENFKRITKAKAVFKKKYRVQYICIVNGERIQFDFRHIGDGYYDTKWEQAILSTRFFNGDVYIPNEENYKYMILYHALVHKKIIAENYRKLLDKQFGDGCWGIDTLSRFIEENEYSFPEPVDLSVLFNEEKINKQMSSKRRIRILFRGVMRKYFNAKL